MMYVVCYKVMRHTFVRVLCVRLKVYVCCCMCPLLLVLLLYTACAAKPSEAIAWLGLGESLHALQTDHSAALEACQTAAQLSPFR
jgi:cytochrome c-type biogenesis protein CcmH/NrfG